MGAPSPGISSIGSAMNARGKRLLLKRLIVRVVMMPIRNPPAMSSMPMPPNRRFDSMFAKARGSARTGKGQLFYRADIWHHVSRC